MSKIRRIGGLDFTDCAAARAQTLFDYLETWVPPGKVPSDVPGDLLGFRPPATHPINLRGRTAHRLSMVQQETALRALLPSPNQFAQPDEHRVIAPLVDTMIAGLLSFADERRKKRFQRPGKTQFC